MFPATPLFLDSIISVVSRMSIDRTQELDKHDNEASSSGEEALRTQYMLMGRLGQGAFSKVRLAYHRLTGVDVAVKEMKRGEYNSLIASEVNVLRMLDHPHVIQLFQVIESEDYIYLVLEHAKSGTLWDKIEHSGRLQEEEARRLFGQVASALCYCHQRGIVHRDLKPDNILLDQAGNVKIADFGLATWFLPGQKLKQGCGVLAFRGPEFYLCQPYDGPKADAWTLGVTLYFMLTAEFPFHGTTYWQLKPQILKGKISLPYYLSTSGRNLIYSLLNYIPWRRPTMEQVLCHPWLTEAAEKPPPIHSSKTLPSHLDPNIMLAMTEMGFDPSQIQDSLLRRRFDEALCIYLMLQRQKCQGLCITGTGLLKLVPWRPMSCPSPTLPSTFPPAPKRSASAPALRPMPCLPPGQQLLGYSQSVHLSHQLITPTTMTHLMFQRWSPTPRIEVPQDPEVVLSSLHPGSRWQIESSISSLHVTVKGKQELHSVDQSSVCGTQRPLGRDHPAVWILPSVTKQWSWKAVSQRIINCFLKTCCCVSAQKKSPRNKVVPRNP